MVIRGCIGDGIDHFRFDFVRLATARLGKGDAKGQAASVARRYFWIHDAFFPFLSFFFSRRRAHPSIPRPRQKEIGGKTWPMQKGERIAAHTTAVNCDGFCR